MYKLKTIHKYKRTINQKFKGRTCACIHEKDCENHSHPLTVFSDNSTSENSSVGSSDNSSDDETGYVGSAFVAFGMTNVLLDSGSS